MSTWLRTVFQTCLGILGTFVLLEAIPAQAQRLITTVAGADWSPALEGTRALDLPLSKHVFQIAVDAQSNLYVPDEYNHRVFKIGTDGITHVVAGNGIPGFSGDGGAATSASLYFPTAVAIDSDGNLYIADANNYRIRKVTSNGIISTFAGTGVNGFLDGAAARLGFVVCLVLDGVGNLLVCDNNRIRQVNPSGFVSTIAGNGTAASTGDGGLATAASVNAPQALLVDKLGQIYIGEFNGNVVRRVSTQGIISTFAGTGTRGFSGDGGPASAALLSNPAGLAFDSSGTNLYIGDVNNERIRMIDASGTIQTVAGTGSQGLTGDGGAPLKATFHYPEGLAWDPAGRLLVADEGNGRIRSIIPGISISTVAGNGLFRYTPENAPATQAFLFGPEGVTLDKAGNLYVADAENQVVRKISPDGSIQTIAGVGVSSHGPDLVAATRSGLSDPEGLAIAPNGDLIIADRDNNQVHRITADGISHLIAGSALAVPGFSGDGGPATKALLNLPTGVAFDSAGNLYVSEWGNHRIRKIAPDNTITTFAGNGQGKSSGDGQAAIAASLNTPAGLAIDSAGNVYIAEYFGYRVRKVTTDGRISTLAGTGVYGATGDGGPAANALVGNVYGLAFDAQGNLYVSDTYNNKVRQITPDGLIGTIAGNGQRGFAGDGGVATSAALNLPSGVAVAADGTIYVVDYGSNRVRALQTLNPSVTASPVTLGFNVTSGGGISAQQNITLAATRSGQRFDGLGFSTTTSSNSTWLQLTPPTGTLPASIGVSVDPSKLNQGSYQSTVQVNVPGATPPQVSINVTVSVAAAQPPKMALDAAQLAFAALAGNPNPFRSLTVSNVGAGVLNVNVSASTQSGANWLSVSPGSGSATPGSPLALVVSADPGNLSAGTYTGAVVVSSASEQITVPVAMTVTVPQPVVLISQSGLTFTAVGQGGSPLPQTFGVLNTGTGSMSWTASASTLSGGANWLTISPTSGSVARPYLDVSIVTVSIDASGLTAGDYYGRIDVNGKGAVNSTQTLTVVLNVLPPGSNPGPQVQPTGLIFTGATGGDNPGSQTVAVSNLTSAPIAFGSSQTYVVPGKWLVNVPANATVMPNRPIQMVVQPDFSALSPGVSHAFVTLGFSDGSSRIVNILSVLAPAGAGTSGKEPGKLATGCTPNGIQVLPTNVQQTFTARVDQPNAIEAKLVDSCGVAITPDRGGADVSMRFSNGDPAVQMVHTADGRWSGSWQPRNASASDVRLAITAIFISRNFAQSLGGQTFLSATLVNGAAVPRVDPGRIQNGASFVTQISVAPGTLISIFGSNLAGVQASSDTPFQTTLGDTQVVLGGRSVPLQYASDGQLNAQVPYDIAVNTQLQLLVQRGTALSVGAPLTVAAAQPAIFTVNQQGTGQGTIINTATTVLADANAPVQPGDTVTIYCTGLGAVDPPIPSGTAAPPDGSSMTVNTVTATIGDLPASVGFAGLAPGLTGVYQVIATLDDGVAAGDQVPVTLTVAGQKSPPVTIAVSK